MTVDHSARGQVGLVLESGLREYFGTHQKKTKVRKKKKAPNKTVLSGRMYSDLKTIVTSQA